MNNNTTLTWISNIDETENKKFIRFYIESLNDLYKYKDKLIEVLNRYLVR